MNPSQQTDPVTDCETLIDLVPEYAFGVTDPDQTRLIESGLQNCPEAAERLSEYRHLQDEMRAGVPQVEPPPHLGESLMAAISTPIPFVPVATPPAAPVPVPVAASARRLNLRLAWVAAAAAIVALVATNLYWLSRIGELSQSQDLLRALVTGQQNAFVLTDTDSLHWVRLADSETQSDAAAFMMWNQESKTGLLYARAFPALEPDHIYHLWLKRSGEERVFAGVFSVDENGEGALLFNSPEPIEDFNWAGVTSESPNDAPSESPAPALVGGQLQPA